MGNYKFRLSDMMPNAWFYKLRDMSKAKNTTTATLTSTHLVRKKLPYYTQRPSLSQPRRLYTDKFCTSSFKNSNLIDTHFAEPAQKSSKRESIYHPSPKHVSTARITASPTDIIIDLNRRSFELPPPILTKPIKPERDHLMKGRDEQSKKRTDWAARKASSSTRSRGIKLRANNSPRIARRNANQGCCCSSSSQTKKSSSESFAIVKSSFDPQRDFKDSMVEMILENNLRESKDLVQLLALYLSLNSDGYHDIIVKAFEQIWCDMANLRL